MSPPSLPLRHVPHEEPLSSHDGAGDENSQWQVLLSNVLVSLTGQLATIDLKSQYPAFAAGPGRQHREGFRRRRRKDGLQLACPRSYLRKSCLNVRTRLTFFSWRNAHSCSLSIVQRANHVSSTIRQNLALPFHSICMRLCQSVQKVYILLLHSAFGRSISSAYTLFDHQVRDYLTSSFEAEGLALVRFFASLSSKLTLLRYGTNR
jgi:hypothetical protein